VRKPTVTALADGLIAAGLAARVPNPDDRRMVRLELTETGRATLAAADRAYADRLAPVLADLASRTGSSTT
jgi:DNA-binding MarR family transcriptional regulator